MLVINFLYNFEEKYLQMKIDLKELFNLDENFDEKSTNALLNAINKNHLKEFDYLKFKASSKNLMSMDMDEDTSFKSTYTTAQTLGISKKYLLDTVRHYKNILQKEKENFSIALQNKLDKSINNKKQEAESLTKEISNLEQKVKEIQKAIAQGKKRLSNIDTDVDKVKGKIETTKNNFLQAVNHLEEVILKDEEKIERLL